MKDFYTRLTPTLLFLILLKSSNGTAQIPGCFPEFSFTQAGYTVSFTDNSYFTVGPQNTTWHWDFGDGNTSLDQNPTHTYSFSQPEYIVCLTVTNCAAWPGTCCTETICDTIRFEDVATGIEDQNSPVKNLQVFPNPSSGEFDIIVPASGEQQLIAEVTDLHGRIVFSSNRENVPDGIYHLKLSETDLPHPGTYLIRISNPQKQIATRTIRKL